MKTWRLKRTRQCQKCPWRRCANPRDISGYDEAEHHSLASTIAQTADWLPGADMHIMTCHETHHTHCIGWLVNQLGWGNNIPLRLSMLSCANADKIRTIGKQHISFEETLPH